MGTRRSDCIHCYTWKDEDSGMEFRNCTLLNHPRCEGCAFFKTGEQYREEVGESYEKHVKKSIREYSSLRAVTR